MRSNQSLCSTIVFGLVAGLPGISLAQYEPTPTPPTTPPPPPVVSTPASPPTAAAPVASAGDWKMDVAAQLRPRYFTDSGLDFIDDTGFAKREYVTQRARLKTTLSKADGPTIAISIQDVRLWGEELNTLNDFSAQGLDFQEAYARLPLPVTSGLTLTLGRQEMNLDNQRIVGAVGWAQRGRSLDGVRLRLQQGELDVTGFFMLLSENDQNPDGTNPDGRPGDEFGGVHAHYKFADALKASAMFLSLTNEAADSHRYTLGLVGTGGMNGFGYTGEFFAQLGSQGDESITALMLAAEGKYTLSVATSPTFVGRFEYLSGDGTPEGAFDPFFGTNHKFYGEMDFFLNIPVQTAFLGLMDMGGKVAIKPMEGVGVHLDVHHFRAVEADAMDRTTLGTELDFKATYRMSKNVQWRLLYGIFMPGEAMHTARGIDESVDLAVEHLTYLTCDVTL